MEIGKLERIITQKNEQLEREALSTAEYIIEAIAQKQDLITRTQEEISGMRKKLTELEVKQLDSKTVLGEYLASMSFLSPALMLLTSWLIKVICL